MLQIACTFFSWPSLRIGLAVLCFSSPKQVFFWPSYCQIATDLDKILHTPISVRNTLVGRLRPRSARGRLQAKPKRLCFRNTCNAPVLYRDDSSPRYWRQTVRVEVRSEDGCYREKFRNFVAWAVPYPKQHFFRVLGVPFDYPAHSLRRKQFYPKPVVPMESRDSEGVPFANLQSL